MFSIPEYTEAHVASITTRVEKHGDDEKPAVSIGLNITTANTALDAIDPKLREALFKAAEDLPQLPGMEANTPVLRCNSIDRVTLPTKHEGWTLTIDAGLDDVDGAMVFAGVKADKFVVEPKQGGSIVLRLRLGTRDVDAQRLGWLGMHNGEAIWIKLTPPDAIDGTQAAFEADHPDAGDLFAAQHGGPADDGCDPVIEDDEDAGPELEDRLDNALRAADATNGEASQPRRGRKAAASTE